MLAKPAHQAAIPSIFQILVYNLEYFQASLPCMNTYTKTDWHGVRWLLHDPKYSLHDSLAYFSSPSQHTKYIIFKICGLLLHLQVFTLSHSVMVLWSTSRALSKTLRALWISFWLSSHWAYLIQFVMTFLFRLKASSKALRFLYWKSASSSGSEIFCFGG